jgi:hypothetical protein
MGRPILRHVQIALRLAKVFHSAAHSAVLARACRPTRQARHSATAVPMKRSYSDRPSAESRAHTRRARSICGGSVGGHQCPSRWR